MDKAQTPPCPKCQSAEHVRRVRCKCFCCPPWVCKRCRDERGQAFDFFDD